MDAQGTFDVAAPYEEYGETCTLRESILAPLLRVCELEPTKDSQVTRILDLLIRKAREKTKEVKPQDKYEEAEIRDEISEDIYSFMQPLIGALGSKYALFFTQSEKKQVLNGDIWRRQVVPNIYQAPLRDGRTIAREELKRATRVYLEKPWMHDSFLDQLLTDSLIYAENSATLDFLANNTMHFWERMLYQNYQHSIKLIAYRMGRFALYIAAVVFLYTQIPWLSAGLVIYLLTVAFIKWRFKRGYRKAVTTMVNAYASMNDPMRADFVWSDLVKARDAGAGYDKELFDLIASAMSRQKWKVLSP